MKREQRVDRSVERRFHSLSFRTAFYLFLTALALMLVSSLVQLTIRYHEEVAQIDADLRYIETSYRRFLSDSLYDYDLQQLQLELDGVVRLPYIAYAEVIDSLSPRRDRYIAGDENAPRDRVLRTTLEHVGGTRETVIGELTVAADVSRVTANIASQALLMVLSNGVAIVLMCSVAVVLVRRLYGRHLNHIAAFTRTTAPDGLDVALTLPRRAGAVDDELDLVVSALNGLRLRLKADIDRRVAAEADLKEMMYIASHDLQVPIVSIEGYAAELLEDHGAALDAEGRYCLERLRANAVRMRTLVLSLLDISRLNTKEYPHEWVDLSVLLSNVAEDLAIVLEQAQAELTWRHLPEIYGDRQRLESVFRNLVTNALQYGAGNVLVSVGDAGDIRVHDDGIGVPEGEREKIFQPGERLKVVPSEGVGMGLTFCRKVVLKHDGDIWCESAGEGRGSTFVIRLPRNRVRSAGGPGRR